jgi:hypothetical protein
MMRASRFHPAGIDFGPPEMRAEGVAAAKSFTQPIGELRQLVLEVLVQRLRRTFRNHGLWISDEARARPRAPRRRLGRRPGCPPPPPCSPLPRPRFIR